MDLPMLFLGETGTGSILFSILVRGNGLAAPQERK